VLHDRCDARPAVTFPAAEHNHCLHGSAPQYLAATLQLTSDVDSRRRFFVLAPHPRFSFHQHVESHWVTELYRWPLRGVGMHYRQRSDPGDRAFPVAAARAGNSLPSFVRDERSLEAFQRQLKTVLFRTSFDEDANA